jgi:hypothetical protein
MNNTFNYNPASTAISSMETPKTEEDMVKFVDDVLETLKKPKRGHEKRWKEAILMVAGEQWLDFDEATNNFRGANMANWIPRPTTNYLAKLYDRLVDIFTSGNLLPNAIPATDDQNDIDSAQKAEHLLNYLSEQIKTPDYFIPIAAIWFITTGNVIFYASYDTKAGSKIRVPRHDVEYEPYLMPDGNQLQDANGEPVFSAKKVPKRDEKGQPVYEIQEEGQVVERVLSPFSWYPEITELPHQVTYGVERQLVSMDQLKQIFGEEAVKEVKAEDVSEFDVGSFLDGKLMQPLYDVASDEMVILKTYRSIPSYRWEKGKVIMTAGGKLLHDGDLEPYYDNKLPYRHERYRELPSEFWGISPMDAALPLQKRLNAIDSAIVQHRKTMLLPQIFEPKGANLGEITGRSGARIIWDWRASGGNAPQVKPSIPLSPEILKEREQVLIDLEQIVGTVEVLSGAQPSGVSTIGQTQVIAEQALRRFAPIVRRWRGALGDHEQRKLRIMQEMYNTPRLVRVFGENELLETYYFSGSDIGNTSDVVIRADGGIFFSEAIQQQKVLDAAKMGLLDVSNPAIAAKVMDLLQIPSFANQFNLDAKMARRRLDKVKNGAPVGNPMNPNNPPDAIMARNNDNHFVMFQIISDFTKTTEFESLDQQIQANIGQLMTQHLQQVEAQKAQAVQAVERTRGSGQASEKQMVQSGAVADNASTQQLTAV